MKIVTLVILLSFIIFRNSFTLLKGKRKIASVTTFIYLGRKIIEIFVSFLIPTLLLLEVIKTNVFLPIYFIGLVMSIIGLGFMIWTRIHRNTDWGFMGDKAGSNLFTQGAYRFTRHPYYVGSILVGVGLYLQLNYFLAILMLPVILFILYVIKKEDGYLQEQFGKEYTAYKNKVGIIPWFY